MAVRSSKTKTEGRVVIKCRAISWGKEWTDDIDPDPLPVGGIDGIGDEWVGIGTRDIAEEKAI